MGSKERIILNNEKIQDNIDLTNILPQYENVTKDLNNQSKIIEDIQFILQNKTSVMKPPISCGKNWTKVLSGNFSHMTYKHGHWLTNDDSNLYHSTNGIDWTITTPVDFSGTIRQIIYGKGMWIIHNGVDVYYSQDCVNWNKSTNFTTDTIQEIIFGNGVFIAQVGQTLYRSINGNTWTECQPTSNLTIDQITYFKNTFLAIYRGNYNSDVMCQIYISSNGLEWELIDSLNVPRQPSWSFEPIMLVSSSVYTSDDEEICYIWRYYMTGNDDGCYDFIYSGNGREWYELDESGSDLINFNSKNGVILMVDFNAGIKRIHHHKNSVIIDLEHHIQSDNYFVFQPGNNAYIYNVALNKFYLFDPHTDTVSQLTLDLPLYEDIYYHPQCNMACANGTYLLSIDNNFYYSRNGINWHKEKEFDADISGFSYNANVIHMLTENGLYYSLT